MAFYADTMLCGACGAGDLTRDNPNDRTNAACGNGAVDPGELCDDANAIDEDGCRRDCTLAFCGDGVVRRDIGPDSPALRSCDDGNTEGGDGCSSTCQMKPAVMAWWTRARPATTATPITRTSVPRCVSRRAAVTACCFAVRNAMTATPSRLMRAATPACRRAAATAWRAPT